MKPKVVAIIQARMNSTRLPGKVLLPLAGKPVLWWMLKRISLAESVDEIAIATGSDISNQPIIDFSWDNEESIPHSHYSFGGDEEDVLGRVLAAADYFQADIIVDITADCPMVDPRHIDALIGLLMKDKSLDYASNCVCRDWPDGLDIQVYWTDALIKVKRRFNPPNHVGWNIAQHPEHFTLNHWHAPIHWPDLGLTLDTPEDYEMLLNLFQIFGLDDPGFYAEDAVRYLKKNPKLITNKNVIRKIPEEG